jgi:hypothetical protein
MRVWTSSRLCEHDSEASGSIKDGKFLDHTSYQSASLDVLRNTPLKKESCLATTIKGRANIGPTHSCPQH